MKWTYNIMPFGPTNSPATFINFAHDICSVWQEEAWRCGVLVGDQYNTRIIVDDFVNWGTDLALTLLYMRCQLMVCQAYNLSLSLRKAKIFPARFEFVGVNVCSDGNRPARSKHVLLETWPEPSEVRDVANFIGFGVVLLIPCLGCFMRPLDVAGLALRYLLMSFSLRLGHPLRKPCRTALRRVDIFGLHNA
jgi:hypothetical protein